MVAPPMSLFFSIMLKSCGASQSFLAAEWVPSCRVKGKIALGGEVQSIGIACRALRCHAESLRFSRQTFL